MGNGERENSRIVPDEIWQDATICRANLNYLRQMFIKTRGRNFCHLPNSKIIPRFINYIEMGVALFGPFNAAEDVRGLDPDANISGSITSWQRIAHKILTSQEVIWGHNGPIISINLLRKESKGLSAHYTPQAAKWKNGNETVSADEWPIMMTDKTGIFWEFCDPNQFIQLLSSFYSLDKTSDVVDRMEQDGLFDEDMITKAVPIISGVAEREIYDIIYFHKENKFYDFISKIVQKIGGEKGFAVAEIILDDLEQTYNSDIYSTSHQNRAKLKSIFSGTRAQLKKDYTDWCYIQRTKVITYDMQALARQAMEGESDPIKGLYAYLKIIFDQITQDEKLEEIFDPKDIETASWIIDRVPSEKNMEAGLIPLTAQIIGYQDMRRLSRITLLIKVLWKAILTGDDTIDQSPIRRDERSLYKAEGAPDGIQKPGFVKELVFRALHEPPFEHDQALAHAVLRMQTRLDRGDIRNRKNFTWESDFAVLEENMVDIMQVISWFPEYAAEVIGYNREAAGNLARALEYFGCLLLINNDLENFHISSLKAGDDIGRRINAFMWGFSHSAEIPAELKREFRDLCSDPEIARKVFNFQKMSDEDKAKIRGAVEIGNNQMGSVVRALEAYIRKYYTEAKRYFALAFGDRIISTDENNQEYREVLERSLEGLWQKFEPYL